MARHSVWWQDKIAKRIDAADLIESGDAGIRRMQRALRVSIAADRITRCASCRKQHPASRLYPSSLRAVENLEISGLRCLTCYKLYKAQIADGSLEDLPRAEADFLRWAYDIVVRRAFAKGYQTDLTHNDLVELWRAQDWRCAISGMKMTLKSQRGLNHDKASLDRIDSALGYVVGNVQWVCVHINRMKSNMTEAAFVHVCHKVAEHQQRKALTKKSSSCTGS